MMFPKTLAPCGLRRLSDLLQAGAAAPLWEAGTAAIQLLERRDMLSWPLAPASIFLDAEGVVSLLSGERRQPDTAYQAPECRLSPGHDDRPSAQVYSLCALLYHWLAGAPPAAGEPLASRRAKLREAAAGQALPGEGGAMLCRLLDRGLRLEPTRRQQTTEELKRELEGLAAYLNGEALRTLRIRGVSGVYAGQDIPLCFPVTLGRQPETCQLLFPPDTPGVSRRHCRLELRWGSVLVTDLKSSYGTRLDGARLDPLIPSEWMFGQSLFLGSDRQQLVLCACGDDSRP